MKIKPNSNLEKFIFQMTSDMVFYHNELSEQERKLISLVQIMSRYRKRQKSRLNTIRKKWITYIK